MISCSCLKGIKWGMGHGIATSEKQHVVQFMGFHTRNRRKNISEETCPSFTALLHFV